MGEVSGPFAASRASSAAAPGRDRERLMRFLPEWALLCSIAGIGAGHAVIGRYDLVAAWLGARLGGAVLFAVLAVMFPTLAPYAMGAGYMWGWVLCIPAGLHARHVARHGRLGEHVAGVSGPLFCVLALAMLMGTNWAIKRYVVALYMIPSVSMVPALRVGDGLLAAKGIFRPSLEVGQVVVFPAPDNSDIMYIKRVVGLEGDEIAFEGGLLHRNGEPVASGPVGVVDYFDACDLRSGTSHDEGGYRVLIDEIPSPLSDAAPVVVPPGHVFLAGDNRDHSGDSRAEHVGTVPVSALAGTGASIWWSTSPCEEGRFRWDRLGTPL